jgi:hypothetical protein
MAKHMKLSPVTQQLLSLADDAFTAGNKEQCIHAISLLYELYFKELPVESPVICAYIEPNIGQTNQIRRAPGVDGL